MTSTELARRSRSPQRSGSEQNVWQTYLNPQGYPYYHNNKTQSTVWERPSGPSDKVLDYVPPPSPATGKDVIWNVYKTAEGRSYYHQADTNQTIWERPSGPNDRIVGEGGTTATTGQTLTSNAALYGQYQYMQGGALLPGTMIPGTMLMPHSVVCGFPGVTQIIAPNIAAQVETFIVENNIDQNAAGKLRSLNVTVQQQVLERGSLTEARNPNAVLMSRIRDAERTFEQARLHPQGSASPSVEEFIMENGIDASAGAKLRALAPDLQAQVLERGRLTDARNPNAMLIGRIREIERNSGEATATTNQASNLITPAASGAIPLTAFG